MNADDLNKMAVVYELLANVLSAIVFIILLIIGYQGMDKLLINAAAFGLMFQMAYLFTVPIFLGECASENDAANKKHVLCCYLQWTSWLLLGFSLVFFLYSVLSIPTASMVMFNGL